MKISALINVLSQLPGDMEVEGLALEIKDGAVAVSTPPAAPVTTDQAAQTQAATSEPAASA